MSSFLFAFQTIFPKQIAKPDSNEIKKKAKISEGRDRSASHQGQRDRVAVHVGPRAGHNIAQFPHKHDSLVCCANAVGVVVIKGEYAFDLCLAFFERSERCAQLAK